VCRNRLASDVPVRRCALRPSFPLDDYQASMSGDLPAANARILYLSNPSSHRVLLFHHRGIFSLILWEARPIAGMAPCFTFDFSHLVVKSRARSTPLSTRTHVSNGSFTSTPLTQSSIFTSFASGVTVDGVSTFLTWPAPSLWSWVLEPSYR
jgi:hypothetical protein